ncbi:MAG: sulfur oxidation c-type cytochrome SoxX [Rubrivivax sp.]
MTRAGAGLRFGAVLVAALACAMPASAAPAHAVSPGAADPGAAPVSARGPIGTVGDAIPEPLHGLRGDSQRGRALVVDRRAGLCLLCHSGPFPEERSPGNLSTDLGGAGARWSEGQLRLRIVDPRRLNHDTLMPPYHRVDGLHRVGEAWRDRPLFTAQQVEDVVAFLMTLR